MADQHLAVLRLGRLGDLVMIEPALRWLSGRPGLRVSLVTGEPYRALFDELLPEVEVVSELESPDLVLDLHRVAGSRRLRRGQAWVGVHKEDLRRRLRVLAPGLGVRSRKTWPERHLDAAERTLLRLGRDPGPRPDPVPSLPVREPVTPGLLGLCPGAGWATKRWPVRRWRELADSWEGEVLVLAAPDELESAREIGAPVWERTDLGGLVAGLSRCEVVVAGDTGPLHLAAALGRRVVGLFGPTPVDTGFWVWGDRGVPVRAPAVDCMPCSLHGTERCPRGHHRCLVELESSRVLGEAQCVSRS